MTKENELIILERLSDVDTELDHISSRLYDNDNERADRNSLKLFQARQIILDVMNDYDA